MYILKPRAQARKNGGFMAKRSNKKTICRTCLCNKGRKLSFVGTVIKCTVHNEVLPHLVTEKGCDDHAPILKRR